MARLTASGEMEARVFAPRLPLAAGFASVSSQIVRMLKIGEVLLLSRP